MNRKLIPLLLLLLLLALTVPLLAQMSARYDQSWHVLSGGGGPRTSANYQVDDVLGQWADGRSMSGRYQVDPGFWHVGRAHWAATNYLPLVSRR